jgi:hypothetical protein
MEKWPALCGAGCALLVEHNGKASRATSTRRAIFGPEFGYEAYFPIDYKSHPCYKLAILAH